MDASTQDLEITLGDNHGRIILLNLIITTPNIDPQVHRFTIVAFQSGVNRVIVIYFCPWEHFVNYKTLIYITNYVTHRSLSTVDNNRGVMSQDKDNYNHKVMKKI